MTPSLAAALRKALCASEHSAKLAQQSYRAVQLGGARGTARKVSFLLFAEGRAGPSLVIKTARDGAAQDNLRREFRILRDVAMIRALDGHVPRPVTFFEFQGQGFAVETCVEGTSLAYHLRAGRWRRPRHVRLALESTVRFLESLQRDTLSADTVFGQQEALDALAAHDIRERVPEPLYVRLLQQCDQLHDRQVPLSARHGDPWPGNVFLDGRQVGMIDWEGFGREDIPGEDVIQAALTLCQTYPWQRYGWTAKADALQRAFLGSSWMSRVIRDRLTEHLSHRGVPRQSTELLVVLWLAARDADARGHKGAEFWKGMLDVYARGHAASVLAGDT